MYNVSDSEKQNNLEEKIFLDSVQDFLSDYDNLHHNPTKTSSSYDMLSHVYKMERRRSLRKKMNLQDRLQQFPSEKASEITTALSSMLETVPMHEQFPACLKAFEHLSLKNDVTADLPSLEDVGLDYQSVHVMGPITELQLDLKTLNKVFELSLSTGSLVEVDSLGEPVAIGLPFDPSHTQKPSSNMCRKFERVFTQMRHRSNPGTTEQFEFTDKILPEVRESYPDYRYHEHDPMSLIPRDDLAANFLLRAGRSMIDDVPKDDFPLYFETGQPSLIWKTIRNKYLGRACTFAADSMMIVDDLVTAQSTKRSHPMSRMTGNAISSDNLNSLDWYKSIFGTHADAIFRGDRMYATAFPSFPLPLKTGDKGRFLRLPVSDQMQIHAAVYAFSPHRSRCGIIFWSSLYDGPTPLGDSIINFFNKTDRVLGYNNMYAYLSVITKISLERTMGLLVPSGLLNSANIALLAIQSPEYARTNDFHRFLDYTVPRIRDFFYSGDYVIFSSKKGFRQRPAQLFSNIQDLFNGMGLFRKDEGLKRAIRMGDLELGTVSEETLQQLQAFGWLQMHVVNGQTECVLTSSGDKILRDDVLGLMDVMTTPDELNAHQVSLKCDPFFNGVSVVTSDGHVFGQGGMVENVVYAPMQATDYLNKFNDFVGVIDPIYTVRSEGISYPPMMIVDGYQKARNKKRNQYKNRRPKKESFQKTPKQWKIRQRTKKVSRQKKNGKRNNSSSKKW